MKRLVQLGLAGALASTQLLTGFLFGLSAADPITYTGVTAILLLVAVAACWEVGS